jgi:hypothetical protein
MPMKKIAVVLILLLAVVFVFFKMKGSVKQSYLAKVNNYVVSRKEFNDEFYASPYGQKDTPKSRKDFLQDLIRRKLILQEAQANGFDRNSDFIRSIQGFWEESLLNDYIRHKMREIIISVEIPDSEVEAEYSRLKKDGKTEKSYQEMYAQIKYSLTREKEKELFSEWLASLYKKADIRTGTDYFADEEKGKSSHQSAGPAVSAETVKAGK